MMSGNDKDGDAPSPSVSPAVLGESRYVPHPGVDPSTPRGRTKDGNDAMNQRHRLWSWFQTKSLESCGHDGPIPSLCREIDLSVAPHATLPGLLAVIPFVPCPMDGGVTKSTMFREKKPVQAWIREPLGDMGDDGSQLIGSSDPTPEE